MASLVGAKQKKKLTAKGHLKLAAQCLATEDYKVRVCVGAFV
jgi:hypothetical protein